jgi:glucose/arabinose dehydrogenase
MSKKLLLILNGICLLAEGLSAQALHPDSIFLDKLLLPEGYKIEVYASGLPGVSALDIADDGTLFTVSAVEGHVYAIPADRRVIRVDTGLAGPSGVDFYNGDLYVADGPQVTRYKNILAEMENWPEPEVLNGNFPPEKELGGKYIRIGPDQKMYISLSADCNICMPDSIWEARIIRMSLDGNSLEVFASGVRNCQGMDWDPNLGVMWFTDMSREDLGPDLPPDELNKALIDSQHFGFPFVAGGKPDMAYWPKKPRNVPFTNAAKDLPAHSGASGMCFYTGNMLEDKYAGGIFIAENGSTGRKTPAGCRISFVPLNKEGRPMGYEVFCDGWLHNGKPWGRPADVRTGPDGALYITDSLAGCIYRIYREL